MNLKLCTLAICCFSVASVMLLAGDPANPKSSPPSAQRIPAAESVPEARARAMLLHESMHGTLQVVHRDFFDEDNAHAIPSASLEEVFEELAESYGVELKWLNVETDVVNVDHQAEDGFERSAVAALKSGKPTHEAVEQSRYRFAGRIRLASQCLKCHVKHRTSTEDRSAGLLIAMPLKLKP